MREGLTFTGAEVGFTHALGGGLCDRVYVYSHCYNVC